MAQHRTKDEYIEAALKAIEEYKLIFITEVHAYLGISRARLYQLELEKVDSIKEALLKNSIDIKVALRKRWYDSDNPTLQIILFKLMAEDDERKRISTTYSDVTTGGDKIAPVNRFSNMSDEQLAKIGKELSHLMTEDTEDEPEDDTTKSATA